MTQAKQKPVRSKTYKSGDVRAKGVLREDVVEVTVKLDKLEWKFSPLRIPVAEWTERRTANPLYDKWEYLDSRYNKRSDPGVNRILDAVRKAADEVTGDNIEPPKASSDKSGSVGFRVFKLTPPGGPERTALETLYEVMLDAGIPLSAPIETFRLRGLRFYCLGERFEIIICLELELNRDLILAMAVLQPQWVICRRVPFIGKDDLRDYAVQTLESRGVKGFLRVRV